MAHHKKESECGSYNYLLHLPEGCAGERRNSGVGVGAGASSALPSASGWPLVLFLHGADHKGVDLDVLRSAGIARLCEDRIETSSPSVLRKSRGMELVEEDDGAFSDVEDMVESEGALKKSLALGEVPLAVDAVDFDAESPRSTTANLNMGHATALARRLPHRRTPSTACDVASSGCSLMPHMQSFPFIVVSPLCPPFKYWRVELLASLLEEVCDRYHIDRRRVYAVGEGMGGWAVCALAARLPRCIAACVPIGAAIDPDLVDVERLKDTPMWIFHGHTDTDVIDFESEEHSQENDTSSCDADDGLRASMHLARSLRRQGARSVLFTAYPMKSVAACSSEQDEEQSDADSMPGVYSFANHGSSSVSDENELVKRSYTYDNPLLYQWLLQHTLPLLDV